MAHRSDLRGMFSILSMGLIVPKIEKTAMSTPNTGYIAGTIEDGDDLHSITVSHVMTPRTLAFLAFLLSILAPGFSVLDGKKIEMAATYMLIDGLLPFIMIIRCQ